VRWVSKISFECRPLRLSLVLVFSAFALVSQGCHFHGYTNAVAEKLMCVLRDGRKLIGYLRSIDQFGVFCACVFLLSVCVCAGERACVLACACERVRVFD
jgi:hypothetical protein